MDGRWRRERQPALVHRPAGEAGDARQRLARRSDDVLVTNHGLASVEQPETIEEQVVDAPPKSDEQRRIAVLPHHPVDGVPHDLTLGRRVRRAPAVSHQVHDAQIDPGNPAKSERVRRRLGRVDDHLGAAHGVERIVHASEQGAVAHQVAGEGRPETGHQQQSELPVPGEVRVQVDELRGLRTVPPAEGAIADRPPEGAVPEPRTASAEPVLDQAVRGQQPELSGGEVAGDLADHPIDEGASAPCAASDVEDPGHRWRPPRSRSAG